MAWRALHPLRPAGQPQGCAAKSNDHRFPLLLERRALTGALVTIDAVGCQARIVKAILDRGGDYLLAVKDNQPNLHEAARHNLDHPAVSIHGRCERQFSC